MSRDQSNLLVGLLVLLPLCMGCAATQASNPRGEGNNLYGTWRWLGGNPGRLSAVHGETFTNDCSCTRELTMEPDGKYAFTERDSLHEKSKAGAYAVHSDSGVAGRAPWLDFEKGLEYGDARDHRVFRFRGPDTLLLRQAHLGAIDLDGGADLFVRAPEEAR